MIPKVMNQYTNEFIQGALQGPPQTLFLFLMLYFLCNVSMMSYVCAKPFLRHSRTNMYSLCQDTVKLTCTAFAGTH